MRLRMILPVILATGWATAGAQDQASEVVHSSSWRKRKLEALRAQVAAEKAELSHLREQIAHARVAHAHQQQRASPQALQQTSAAAENAVVPMHQALQSLPALSQVVQALARKAAREEEARVKEELQVNEAKLGDTKPTAARKLRIKSLLSLPTTAQAAQAVSLKVSQAEEELAKVEDASAKAKRKLQIQEAKDFLAAAKVELKEHDQEAKQFLFAALEALKDGDAHEEEAENGAAAAKARNAAETQKAVDAKKARASLLLRRLEAEKAEEKARLAVLKDRLRKAKDAVFKVREATSRVKDVSHKLLAEPLELQPRHASMQLSKANQYAAVVHKLEADKAAEQRALEQEKQSHKAVMTDMIELQKVEAKLMEDMHH
eukprot:TRINITY_DN104380_c0_g1_i1.p1 TRINITY_DN104380_c0_g1~~TRINITY_DN104380_c0_g1_i1.p1  ORF type:complete len:376 (+),score=134.99 TRINITY_DN104380_c0_g1_i1:86-1213(+)